MWACGCFTPDVNQPMIEELLLAHTTSALNKLCFSYEGVFFHIGKYSLAVSAFPFLCDYSVFKSL